MTRRRLLAAAIVAGIVSVLIAVSGGFVVSAGGVRVSARSWTVSAAAAVAAALAWAWSARRAGALADDLRLVSDAIEARGQSVALGLAALTFAGALAFATYSASGSDASGYLSQAAMWSRLESRIEDPLVVLPDWPLPAGDTAPLGWRPALDSGWQVPTYAPGLPWLMAIPQRVFGTAGAVWIIALAAGTSVWATGVLASRLGGGIAAVLAAATVATSPTFLYHAFQPMSDVPVTAAWTACWLLVAGRMPGPAGSSAALAVLIRPNLAPLALAPLVVATLAAPRAAAARHALRFAMPVAVAGLVIGGIQWWWYGSPLRSGYGTAADLFSLANVAANTRLYASWLWEAERALVLLAALALVSVVITSRGEPGPSRPTPLHLGLSGFAAGVVVAYLVYAVFEVWTYLRFLLPAASAAIVLASHAFASGIRRLPSPVQGATVVVLVAALSAVGIHSARMLGVFRIAEHAARARETGDRLRHLLPERAVLLAGEQSGSMRYATGRPVVRWEALDAPALRSALSSLRRHGYEPWWVLDQFEEAGVRARFSGVAEAALDWPPEVEAGPLMRTRAWRVPSPATP